MRRPFSAPVWIDSNRCQPTSAAPPDGKGSSSAETLLVVDDDPTVRELVTQILLLKGYRVLQAQNAAEALRLASGAETIHLLITDFSMPDIDGLELSRRFRTVQPKAPVLLVSGSAPLLDEREHLDRVQLLAKPFAVGELLHRVRTLLDASEPHPPPKRQSRD